MVGNIVSSEFVDVGAINIAPKRDVFPPNSKVLGQFETVGNTDLQDRVSVIGQISVLNMTLLIPHDKNASPDMTDAVTGIVGQADELYRQYREVPDETRLKHDVTYLLGKSRANALHTILGGVYPFTTSGSVHFDDMGANDEAIIASHAGVPTRIYTGPVRRFGYGFTGSLSPTNRLFVPTYETTPEDRAILIDRNTLHQQQAQFFSRKNPCAFFRTAIEVI